MKKLYTKIKALEDELKYCQYKYDNHHPSSHWQIRIKEITQELLTLKKGESNVKATKARIGKKIRKSKKQVGARKGS